MRRIGFCRVSMPVSGANAPTFSSTTCICTPNSLSQEVKLGLGAQAGERRLRNVFAEAGFSRFRRATETPFNLVLEARK